MGTNFYTLKDKHIGKRSAAGIYCWDCGISLCKAGNEGIHQSESEFFKKCPLCKGEKGKETLENSSAGRELGFKTQPTSKKGAKSCSSFTWAIIPYKLKAKTIKDEYGRKFTREEFDKILQECPIYHFGNIGIDFC